MACDFQPNLSILQVPQKRLWGELVDVPGRLPELNPYGTGVRRDRGAKQ